MNIFKKLFGSKEKEIDESTTDFKPDNTKLLELIKTFQENQSGENYGAVVKELYGNQAFLIVPTQNKISKEKSDTWETLKAGETIEFKTVFNVDGLLVFGVFTSEIALSKWIKEETPFLAMPAKSVLEIAEEQSFGRIVIDSNQETMFVLERNVSNIKQDVIKEETQVQVWYPKEPISGIIKEQLLQEFGKVSVIEEVYHFGMTRNGETILILGFKLSQNNENSRLAVMGALNNAMNGKELALPLELMYFNEGDSWLKTAREYDLFYKK